MTTHPVKYTVNGIEMNVHIEGKGPDVLLLHGFPDTHEVWRKQIPALVAAGYRVIAPDTRGCGESEMPKKVGDYTIDHLVADVVGLLDLLEIKKVRLIAHDWGAAIGWQVCMKHPERIDRYVALSVGHPKSYANDGVVQKMKGYYVHLIQLRGITEALSKLWNWFFLRNIVRFDAEFPNIKARLSRPGRLTAGFNYYRANYFNFLRYNKDSIIHVPVFGIYSTGDIFLSKTQMVSSEKYVQAPWRCQIIEGANHWLQLTAAEKLNPLLVEYLR